MVLSMMMPRALVSTGVDIAQVGELVVRANNAFFHSWTHAHPWKWIVHDGRAYLNMFVNVVGAPADIEFESFSFNLQEILDNEEGWELALHDEHTWYEKSLDTLIRYAQPADIQLLSIWLETFSGV